jgi:hypothetical protein
MKIKMIKYKVMKMKNCEKQFDKEIASQPIEIT